MGADQHNITRRIRQLDEASINRIAAGEVVERPASAVKELVENALDAGARRISIDIADGGRALIRVTDDGHGIPAADLPLALSRHATSKLDGDDLLAIHHFGFRGEALPSLGAVGRLTITSRAAGEAGAASISVTAGQISPTKPAGLSRGTVVELRDLFFATPARLKFLKSARAETMAITDQVKRLAMAQPEVAFTLTDDGRSLLRLDAASSHLDRLTALLGRDFAANQFAIDAARDGFHLAGHAALPTYSRGTSAQQYLFVNGRPVRDRMLTGALRAAYMDVLPRDRHAVAALYLACDHTLVDVNVHPAKTEVRFREAGIPRGLIVSALRHALAGEGHRSSSTVSDALLGAAEPERPKAPHYQMDRPSSAAKATAYHGQAPMGFAEAPSARVDAPPPEPETVAMPLGAARAQLHENWIVAQTEDGLVIVDAHAAHERLNYERLKAEAHGKGIAAQALLLPEIVELGDRSEAVLALDLSALGLEVEPFGPGAIAIRATPAILGPCDAGALIRDIVDELEEGGDEALSLRGRIDAVLSRMACHGSVRTGRRMSGPEMDALLREMEATPKSGQCNHGRPTYVKLALGDIERLFGR